MIKYVGLNNYYNEYKSLLYLKEGNMKIKKKFMSKECWKRVIKRKYITKDIENGKVSLLLIEKVDSPSIKTYEDGTKIKIADDNFYWLQIGLKNKNYWITAMYNEYKELIQIYIDVTLKNIIDDNPAYFDLFLDIVLIQDGKMFLLDKEELENAFYQNDITKQEYSLAKEEAEKILNQLPKRKDNLIMVCNKYLEILLKELENK